MATEIYKFGDLIELTNEKNTSQVYGVEDAIGVNIDKVIVPMRGDNAEKEFSKFHLVPPKHFAYNPRGSRKLGLGYNNTKNTYIITFNDNVFRVKKSAEKKVLDTYLFMYLCRQEWDRFAEYISWGSSTEVFDWKEFCDISIALPDINVQQKYVQIYESMIANQKSYEQGLDDLKLTCDAYLDKLKKECDKQDIGKYIAPCDLRNESEKLTIENLRGISTEKKFINTKADMMDVSLKNYKIVKQNEFVYVADTSRRGDKIALGFNDSNENILVSSIYTVFKIIDTDAIDPHYLMMFFTRNEFDRYARFNSWGSARETFDWSEMCSVKIPIPDIKVQRAIADIYKVYTERKRINEQLKQQIKDICPILIKGSLEE